MLITRLSSWRRYTEKARSLNKMGESETPEGWFNNWRTRIEYIRLIVSTLTEGDALDDWNKCELYVKPDIVKVWNQKSRGPGSK